MNCSLASRGVLLLGVLPFLTSAGEASPATAPAAKAYRMVAQTVDGSDPATWVLVIITPEGYAWVTTPGSLHDSIRRRVPQGATLEWVPQDTVRGGEPLRCERDLDALREVCKEQKVSFVHVPAG